MTYAIHRDELTIRAIEASDAPAVFACRTRPEVARYQGWFPRDVAEVEAYARELAGRRPGTPGVVQVVLEAAGEFVGDFGVVTDALGKQVELGIALLPERQGRGIATRACRLLLDDLFAHGIHRAVARMDPRNPASQRLFERLSFRREGHERECYWDLRAREWTDEYVYAVLAREWRG